MIDTKKNNRGGGAQPAGDGHVRRGMHLHARQRYRAAHRQRHLVAIDACVRLSRSIEEELDRDEEDFSLTVASAGIGSELKCLRQYRKLVGSTVEVLLTSGIKVLAKLDAADDQASPSPTRRAGRQRQKTQATGDGDAPLRLQRNQVRAGVAGFQIGTRARTTPDKRRGAAGKNKHKLKTR